MSDIAAGTMDADIGPVRADTLVRGAWVLPGFQDGDDQAVADGAVAVAGSRVLEVGPWQALAERHPGARVLGGPRYWVLPGLINAHHHGRGVDSFRAGVRDDWLEAWIGPFTAAPRVDPALDTLYGDLRLLRSGVTTVLHHAYASVDQPPLEAHRAQLEAHLQAGIRVAYAVDVQDMHPLVYEDSAALLSAMSAAERARVQAALEILALPSAAERPARAARYVELVETLAGEYAGKSRVRVLFGPEGPEWCSPALLQAIGAAAGASGRGIHIHLLESPLQRLYAERHLGGGSCAWLRRFGLLGPNTSLAHGVWMSEQDMALAAEAGATVVHNPGSNLRLRNGVLPTAALEAAGVGVALGSDAFGLGARDDQFLELRLAYTLAGSPSPQPYAARPSPERVLHWASAGGARASGFGQHIGRLRPGAEADLILLDAQQLSAPLLAPDIPPAEAVLALGSPEQVHSVMVGGELVLEAGRPTRVDLGALEQRLAGAAACPPSQAARTLAAGMRTAGPWIRRYYQEHYPEARFEPFQWMNAR